MNAPSLQARPRRLLQILCHLQSGNGLNATEMASRLEVCRRTIFRDISVLRAAGVEILFDEAMDCYRLAPEADFAVTPQLSPEELLTLVAAVHLSVLQGLPSCDELLRRSTTKLLASSPHHVRHAVTRLTKSCTVRTPAAEYTPQAAGIVQHVLQAIRQRRTLRLTLADTSGLQSITTRFSPYQVQVTSEAWQMTGRSSHHRGVRTFDPRQIETADMTDEIYAIPRGYGARH